MSGIPPPSFRETYPGPWRIEENPESFVIKCGETKLAYIYFEDELNRRRMLGRLSRAEAAALAGAIVGPGQVHR